MKIKSFENIGKVLNELEAGIVLIDSDHRICWKNQKVDEWFGPLKIGERRKCYRINKYNKNFCRICPTRRAINFGIPSRYKLDFELNESQCEFEIIGLPINHGSKNKSLVMELILNNNGINFEKKETKDIVTQMEKMAAIGDLAAGIAHELNTPLATISIISEELKHIIGKKANGGNFNEIEEYLSDIDGEIKRCVSIVEDVQNFSRKGTQKKKSVNITDIILKTMGLIHKAKTPKGLVIKKNLKIYPQVNTDPDRLRQVLLNILKNAVGAVRYSRRKREISISLKRDDKYIIIQHCPVRFLHPGFISSKLSFLHVFSRNPGQLFILDAR